MKEENRSRFEKASTEKHRSLIAEFLDMVKAHKKYWLIPLIAALLVLGLITLLGGSAAAPFIYTLF